MRNDIQIGDHVLLRGEVTATMAHHNGVTSVTIRFGQGVERHVIVPDHAVIRADMLDMATEFTVIPLDRKRVGIRVVEVVKRSSDPDAWAIHSEGHCLAKDGEWEWESLPSSRTEEFLQRCRWPTAIEAITFATDHMKKHPTGYKE